MKFITTRDEEGNEDVFVFPRRINHDAMAEALEGIKDQTHGDWNRIFRQPIAAGFVSPIGVCHGSSETLGLTARPEDTTLLTEQTNSEAVREWMEG